MAKVKVFVQASHADADADADTRAMTLVPRTYVPARLKVQNGPIRLLSIRSDGPMNFVDTGGVRRGGCRRGREEKLGKIGREGKRQKICM